jgi:hypothetical protein
MAGTNGGLYKQYRYLTRDGGFGHDYSGGFILMEGRYLLRAMEGKQRSQ